MRSKNNQKQYLRISDLLQNQSNSNEFASLGDDSFEEEAEIPNEINYFNKKAFEN